MTAQRPRGPVVIGYDGSEEAAGAIAAAGVLVGGGEAIVAHTWVGLSRFLFLSGLEGLSGPVVDAADELDEGDERQAAKVAEEGARLAGRAGFDARPLAVRESDNPWRTLLACARDHDAAVVVVGRRGQSALRGFVLGSVSNALAQRSHCPLLIVPASEPDDRSGPALFCYDGSENSQQAIRQGAPLLPGRPAVVLRMWEPWATRMSYVPLVSGTTKGMAEELDEMAQNRAAEIAEEGLGRVRDAGLEADCLSRKVDVSYWRTALEVASEREAAVVVLGSRGLGGATAALGSVSHGVLQHSDRPVLIVPPAPADEGGG